MEHTQKSARGIAPHHSSTLATGTTVEKIPAPRERKSEELVLAVVGPVGSGSSLVGSLLREILQHDYGYAARTYTATPLFAVSLDDYVTHEK